MSRKIFVAAILTIAFAAGFLYGRWTVERYLWVPQVAPIVVEKELPLRVSLATESAATTKPTVKITVSPTKKPSLSPVVSTTKR